MFLAIQYIPAYTAICYILDDGFIFFKPCNCNKPLGWTVRDTFPGETVEFLTSI